MALKVSIGDFSRMTHLSVKALRYYQDVGLLSPAGVDRETSYRWYDLSQVPAAQVIRRFRDLGMPVERIKAVLSTSDVAERNSLVVAHLRQMESGLERTQQIVASLRALLEESAPAIRIEYRSVPELSIASITGVIDASNLATWWLESFAEIDRALRQQRITPAGPRGGLFPTELFAEEVGEITLFVPIDTPMSPSGNVVLRKLPPVELAIAVHRGSLSEADRTFAPLGAHVLERTTAVEGSIREHYIVTGDDVENENQLMTEIGWPIFRTSAN
jgi:DNA-binding transcriptional MerR regulator